MCNKDSIEAVNMSYVKWSWTSLAAEQIEYFLQGTHESLCSEQKIVLPRFLHLKKNSVYTLKKIQTRFDKIFKLPAFNLRKFRGIFCCKLFYSVADLSQENFFEIMF